MDVLVAKQVRTLVQAVWGGGADIEALGPKGVQFISQVGQLGRRPSLPCERAVGLGREHQYAGLGAPGAGLHQRGKRLGRRRAGAATRATNLLDELAGLLVELTGVVRG